MNNEKPQFDYLNFDLLIEAAGNAYVARVTNSPAGEAATKFNVPFSALELENFLLKIGRPRHGVRRLNSPEMEAAKVFGGRLFDSVFGSEVFGCLRQSQYHVFHFIGHGGYDVSARDGVLLLEDETRHSRKVSGQFLGMILHNHRPLSHEFYAALADGYPVDAAFT